MSLTTAILDTKRKRPLDYYVLGVRFFADSNTTIWASRSVTEHISSLGSIIKTVDHHEVAREHFGFDAWTEDIFFRRRWLDDVNLSVVAAWCCKLWFLCNAPDDEYAIWLDAGCPLALIFNKDMDAAKSAYESGFRLNAARLEELARDVGRDVIFCGNGIEKIRDETDLMTAMAVAAYFIAVKRDMCNWLFNEFKQEMNNIIINGMVYTEEYALGKLAIKHGIKVLPLMEPIDVMRR